jgi:tripartite-type tricarboxylate transporter receptor subunit TctC
MTRASVPPSLHQAGRLTRRGVLGAGLSLPFIRASRADEASGGKITLLVGATEGSGADQTARAFVPFLERHLPGTEITISNLPGEAGLAAYRAVAWSPSDGLTVGWIATPSLPARTVDCPRAAGVMERLRLIAAVQKEPIAFVSSSESPLTSAQDIIARSSEHAEAVPLGTPPAGTPPHIAALRLQALSGTKLNIVAFPSAAAARQAALSGTVAAACLGLGSAIDDLRNGRLTGLGLAARNRSDAFPDMPALGESGLKLSAFIRRGLATPAALPIQVAARYADALAAVVADPEFGAQGDSSGFLASWLDGAAWTAQAARERTGLTHLWATEPWSTSDIG